MRLLLDVLTFFFYVPVKLFQSIKSNRKEVIIERSEVYYFVGVWVAHLINDQYQSSFYSIWIKKYGSSIPTEKEVKSHLVALGLDVIHFKIISISIWQKKDYDDYIIGVYDEQPKDYNTSKIEDEIDYQVLIDKAVADENYEEAARLKKKLEENKNDGSTLGE